MPKTVQTYLLIVLAHFSVAGFCSGDPAYYSFTHIEAKQGLSHNQVYSIFKDSKGFMWFGTNFGLNRFDGYSFKVFRHIPSDPNSLADNRVRGIFEGPGGKLWISLLEGFVIYNPVSEEFSGEIPFSYERARIPASAISRLRTDKTGNIWMISDELGLFCYSPASDSVTHYETGSDDEEHIHSQAISSLAADKDGKIWMIGFHGIIERLDPNTEKVIFRTDFLNKLYPESRSLQLFIDRDDHLWIYSSSSNEGIVLYKPETNEYKQFSQGNGKYSLSSNIVNTVAQSDEGQIWIGTDHGGINILNKDDFSVQVLQHNPEDERSISHNSINTLYKDNEGIIWAGTFKKGVCYYHKNLYKFKLYRHRQNDPESLPFDDVNCFQEDENGNLWIGTNGNGLCYFNRATNSFKVYSHNPSDESSLSNNVIVSMLYDSRKQLWLGTFYGGLNRFNGSTFRHFRHQPGDPSSLANDRVWELYEDALGYVWIGTLGSGLELYDPQTETFRHFPNGEPGSVHSAFILHITGDKAGNLWIGTANGIEYYERAKETFTHFANIPDNTNSLSYNVASSIVIDRRGLVWIATQEGLNVFDSGKGIFRRYYVEHGLADNTVVSVIEDDKGDIWAATTKGITHIKLKEYRSNDDFKLEFINYNEADGLQGREFNEGVAYKTSRGELIFGGPDGFNLFNPSELTYNLVSPAVAITDFQILNKSIRVGQQVSGRVFLKKSISETEQVVLKHFENVFSIEFSALNFIHPEKNQFEYMLEGFNREWIQSSAGDRKATYTNLDPGEYLFRVRASNNDFIWNREGASLIIVVRPPLWKTKGALAFYALMLLMSLFLLRYMILQRERLKFRIEQEKQEALRRHEMDLLKIRFFTNVSHEFRTPLSLIITPLEKILKNPEKEGQLVHLKLIYRNARRLLNLVNQLLDFRRMEVQKINLKPAYGDVIAFTDEIYQTFTDLAEKKSIDFRYHSSHKQFLTFFDHDKLEKIIFNLLSNAFKFTPAGKSILLDLAILNGHDQVSGDNVKEGSGNTLCLKVSDTGMGIPKENLEKIFERFFQNDMPGNLISQGSGIGLSLTKEFVQLHNGTITVESELHQGSTFTVRLPLITEASFAEKEIVEESSADKTGQQPENPEEKLASHTILAASILLVEDNDDFRFYLKDNLKVNYTIFEAANGKEGLEQVQKHLPDLIVSDVMMPEMDGFELCNRIKTNPNTSHIPIILLTARMAEQKKMEGFEAGADDYITKPFSFELLESRITNLISVRQRMKDSFQKHFKIEPGEINITSLDEKLLNKALENVEKNMSNPEFSVEKLSRELGMSRVHLYKKLTALTGKTPIEFIRIMRLKRAAQLLEKSQLTIAEVAYEVGFNDPRYFSKYFKAEFGMLPSQFINAKKVQSKSIE